MPTGENERGYLASYQGVAPVTIYLDQNIVEYFHEGVISPTPIDNIVWVYSNAHFEEMERVGKLEMLQVFEKIRARKIEFVPDDHLRPINKAMINAYADPRITYEEYRNTAADDPQVDFSFEKILALLYGNTGAMDIAEYG